MSICLATKGRIAGPESIMTDGVICKRGLFTSMKAKFVFVRDRVARVFDRGEVDRVFDRDKATITRWYK